MEWDLMPIFATVVLLTLFLITHYVAMWLDNRRQPPMTPLERAILEQLSDQPE